MNRGLNNACRVVNAKGVALIETGRPRGAAPTVPGGFTLIETLMAMMILAVSFVVIMQLFSGGLKSSRITTDYIYGIFHAKEKMSEILLSENLGPGNMSGRFEDGYQWTATVSLIPSADETLADRMPVTPAEVAVEVQWRVGDKEKHIGFKTMTLARKPKIEGLETDVR